MAKNYFLLWSCILCFGLLSQVIAVNLASSESLTTSLVPRQQDDLICQSQRAASYYGLGVRLGIYATWIQSLLANAIMPGEVTAALDKNTIFLFTLLIAMVKCSSMGMLLQIDGLILMHLSGGYIFGILSIWGYRTCLYAKRGTKAIERFGGFGTHFRLLVSLSQSAYGWWYWTYGVTGSLDPMGLSNGNPAECGTLYTFMFAKVLANGMIRRSYIGLYIGGLIYFGSMFLVSSVGAFSKVAKIVELVRTKSWAQSSRLVYATGFSRRE
jgi:hypothetical protein